MPPRSKKTHQREVPLRHSRATGGVLTLVDRPVRKLCTEVLGLCRCRGEDERAGGGLVEPVDVSDPLVRSQGEASVEVIEVVLDRSLLYSSDKREEGAFKCREGDAKRQWEQAEDEGEEGGRGELELTRLSTGHGGAEHVSTKHSPLSRLARDRLRLGRRVQRACRRQRFAAFAGATRGSELVSSSSRDGRKRRPAADLVPEQDL